MLKWYRWQSFPSFSCCHGSYAQAMPGWGDIKGAMEQHCQNVRVSAGALRCTLPERNGQTSPKTTNPSENELTSGQWLRSSLVDCPPAVFFFFFLPSFCLLFPSFRLPHQSRIGKDLHGGTFCIMGFPCLPLFECVGFLSFYFNNLSYALRPPASYTVLVSMFIRRSMYDVHVLEYFVSVAMCSTLRHMGLDYTVLLHICSKICMYLHSATHNGDASPAASPPLLPLV